MVLKIAIRTWSQPKAETRDEQKQIREKSIKTENETQTCMLAERFFCSSIFRMFIGASPEVSRAFCAPLGKQYNFLASSALEIFFLLCSMPSGDCPTCPLGRKVPVYS